ncbi:hypothetical protein ACIBH1_45535 [Nonomuraea sp. NPDC050663]|uniref:hypothetical protein n=1 Tax=Nonomuraea sp. NPDC050663 TaxID=3364370 RepID=UPI0037943670
MTGNRRRSQVIAAAAFVGAVALVIAIAVATLRDQHPAPVVAVAVLGGLSVAGVAALLRHRPRRKGWSEQYQAAYRDARDEERS